MTDTFLVARTSCGCVESIMLPTDNDEDRDIFLGHFPHATPQAAWPQRYCDEHTAPADAAARKVLERVELLATSCPAGDADQCGGQYACGVCPNADVDS